MGKLEIQILDDQWPKLRMVGSITMPNGDRSVFDEKILYDQAYNKFEGAVHGPLAKLVNALVERRKRS